MFAFLLFLVFFCLALGGLPLVFALLATTIGAIWAAGLGHPMETIFLSYIGGVEPFILIAVPLFIFAGELLSEGGVGQRIVNFAHALLGWLPGGLGVVTVASCMMFGGVSGSAIADTAAIGSLTTPSMLKQGYARGFAAALLAVAGTLALLMPLSIPFLVYAFISGVSMRELSMAGLFPALVLALALIIVCIWKGRKTTFDGGRGRFSLRHAAQAAWDAGPALLMPIIIVGGIWSGRFTPTEAAAVAVVYGLIISIYFYRDIQWRDLPRLILKSFQTSATVMLVIGATGALAWLITAEQVAAQLADWVRVVAEQPWQFLALVNIALILLGIFIEPLPAMLLTVPLLLPLAQHLQIDLVHLGVVITANLALALYTPPVGGTLFIAAKLAGASIAEISRALVPLFAASLIVLGIITYVPWLTRALSGVLR